MKEYLLLLRAGKPTASLTEAESNTQNKAWGAYMGNLAQNGQLIGGLPLVSGGAVVSGNGIAAEPVKAANEGIIGGYLIVKAESFDHATKIAADCPHLFYEGNIEVREMAPMPEM